MNSSNLIKQIRSKERVANHGEVFTSIREVNNMLDMVKTETYRIDSRFLEPACGSGMFLIEVLKRKLDEVVRNYKSSKNEFKKYMCLAISSIYGVEILKDNVLECRKNLLDVSMEYYETVFNESIDEKVFNVIDYLLSRNIIHGNALTLMTVDDSPKPIVFSEWSKVNSTKFKRRDYTLSELLNNSPIEGRNLFSDLDEEIFIPKPILEYPVCHYLEIGDANVK